MCSGHSTATPRIDRLSAIDIYLPKHRVERTGSPTCSVDGRGGRNPKRIPWSLAIFSGGWTEIFQETLRVSPVPPRPAKWFHPHPGGMPAISRGSRRAAPTPPDRRRHEFDPGRGRSGLAMRRFRCFACPRRHSLPCSSPIEVLLRMGIPGPLAPLPGCDSPSPCFRGYRFAQPPANGWKPSGFPWRLAIFPELSRRDRPSLSRIE